MSSTNDDQVFYEERACELSKAVEVLPSKTQCLILNFTCTLFQLRYSTRFVHHTYL
jgi:hypothetical protein